jgi:hypothetical protein
MARDARDRAISTVQANSENPPEDAVDALWKKSEEPVGESF